MTKFEEREAKQLLKFLVEDLQPKSNADLNAAIERLMNDEPLQYVTETSWFYHLKFFVNHHVLIPRPETEELVEWVLSENREEHLYIVDACTGSGCIAVTLKKNRPGWRVEAFDNSIEALSVAERNARSNNCEVHFYELDLKNIPTANHQVNLIISNPPYISVDERNEIAPNVLNYEPHAALFAPDGDPLFYYRKLIDLCREMLFPDGHIFVELSHTHADDTFKLFATYFRKIEMRKDISGNYRMLKASVLIE